MVTPVEMVALTCEVISVFRGARGMVLAQLLQLMEIAQPPSILEQAALIGAP